LGFQAGRVIEKVVGVSYEKAIVSLVFEPLGLSHSFFAPGDVMTRRFAVGHNGPRGRNPRRGPLRRLSR
jgi:CubicO group peptidase (beta-lactamase class C family)